MTEAVSEAFPGLLPPPRPRPWRLGWYAVYPWLFWRLCGEPPRWLQSRLAHRPRAARLGGRALHVALYLALGFPATVLVSGELLITRNEFFVGEQADYRLQSDIGRDGVAPLELPGPPTPAPAPILAGPTEAYRRYPVELYAPVILQKVSARQEWDLPVLIDFDGNADPRDNVENEPRFRPHIAGVYGEMTAETEDSYYLSYPLYHIKDYEYPVRELVSHWTFHDNDNEGFYLRVDKRTMQVVEDETWFHNRFLLFNHTGESRGTEPVHGKIHVEGGTT